jgi:hypothetical protein
VASTGKKNFDRNWKGSDQLTTVKKTVPYFKQELSGYKQVGSWSPGTSVTYVDSLTIDHLKAAFSVGDEIYYANVDYFVKPKSAQASAIPLGPSSFGLSNQTFSATSYYTAIQNSINNRMEVPGELFDYLYELLEYVKTGTGDYAGIKFAGFPWGQIQNYYAEVIGPLACIYRGILNGVIPTSGIASAQIYIPPDSEQLYDYKLIFSNFEHLISAKTAKGVSNQVKPQFVTAATEASGKLGVLANTQEFKLLKILGSQGVVNGAFLGWQLIQPDGKLMQNAVDSIISKKFDPFAFYPFVEKYLPEKKNDIEKVTIGQVRYKCEQLIETWSKSGTPNTNLKKIFNIYLNESRVIYVKMDVNKTTGSASFDASAGGGSTLVNRLYLRTSNYAERTSDRIGFQVS